MDYKIATIILAAIVLLFGIFDLCCVVLEILPRSTIFFSIGLVCLCLSLILFSIGVFAYIKHKTMPRVRQEREKPFKQIKEKKLVERLVSDPKILRKELRELEVYFDELERNFSDLVKNQDGLKKLEASLWDMRRDSITIVNYISEKGEDNEDFKTICRDSWKLNDKCCELLKKVEVK